MEKVNFFKLANFFSKQKIFLEYAKNYRYVLLSGAVGTGKSKALRWTLLYLLLKHGKKYPGIQAGLFCNTYPELNDRHLKYIRFEFPEWLGIYYEQKKEFHIKPEYGGGILMFRNLDEPEKYRSAEFAFIGVDELTQIPKETFDLLLERNRWKDFKDVRFLAATNPIGPYKYWVRSFFIEKTSSDLRCKDSETVYLKAGDNPYLPESYYEELARGMDEKMRKALIDGDWYSFDDVIDEKGFIPLITTKELENALISEGGEFIKNPVLGIDPGAGGDNTAIVLRTKNFAKVLFNQKLEDTMQIIQIVMNILKEYPDMKAIFVDIVGIGRGVYDRLREKILRIPVFGVNVGEKAEKENFFNKKAELYWELREWLLSGGKLIKNEAWNELLNIKYQVSSDREVKIKSKKEMLKEGLSSPNVADALILTFYKTFPEKNFEEIVYNIGFGGVDWGF
mgnify:CR=1 FL=1